MRGIGVLIRTGEGPVDTISPHVSKPNSTLFRFTAVARARRRHPHSAVPTPSVLEVPLCDDVAEITDETRQLLTGLDSDDRVAGPPHYVKSLSIAGSATVK